MISVSHHRRFRPPVWGAIRITFMILAVAAAHQLEPRIAG